MHREGMRNASRVLDEIKHSRYSMFAEHSMHRMFAKSICIRANIHAAPVQHRSNVETFHTRMDTAKHAIRDSPRELRNLLCIDRRFTLTAE
jgi:hypothetical protein